jgi:hypothetical protein
VAELEAGGRLLTVCGRHVRVPYSTLHKPPSQATHPAHLAHTRHSLIIPTPPPHPTPNKHTPTSPNTPSHPPCVAASQRLTPFSYCRRSWAKSPSSLIMLQWCSMLVGENVRLSPMCRACLAWGQGGGGAGRAELCERAVCGGLVQWERCAVAAEHVSSMGTHTAGGAVL